ncbi:MAG TPA: hypothetical protein VK449_07340 [Anaerolineales bacterium]|nr:hypothetical protein [Anaerolineales bacterium]
MKKRLAAALGLSFVLLAGCRAAAWRDYHYTDPVEYYFSYPTTTDLRGAPPLLIALLGKDHSPLDCIEMFQPFAVDRHFALLCPKLGGKNGLADRLQAERDLADILTALYARHGFENKFYLAGFGDGGEFALDYAFKYPGSISGVSAMSVDSFPEEVSPLGPMPVQIVVGDEDAAGRAAAQETARSWKDKGILVRLLTVAGRGRAPDQAFARLASEVIEELAQ